MSAAERGPIHAMIPTSDEQAEAELDRRLDAYRAEILREEMRNLRRIEREDMPEGALGARTGVLKAALILDERAELAEEEATAAAATATPELTIYRASHESLVLDWYTTSAEARRHCATLMLREQPSAALDWIEDEEDGVAELVATVDGEEDPTGYLVTALTVASEYDEEADE